MKCVINGKNKDFLSKKMFGLFFEDINYAADGGLYAEMIENRQFAFRKAYAGKEEKTYDTEYAGDYGWSAYPNAEKAELTFDDRDALCSANPHSMKVVTKEEAGFTNKAYDGIYMTAGEEYQLLYWLKAEEYEGDVTCEVLDKNSKNCVAKASVKVSKSSEWKLYTVTVKAKQDVEGGLLLFTQEAGTVRYGYISLIPKNAVCGIFRKDLFDLLMDMKPGFLRFPGGCIVEGANLDNRYQWKDTVGATWERKWNWNRWAVHDITMGQGEPIFFPFYNQSYGIGFYEYFLLSELLGAKPLPVLSVALACQFQSDELVPIDEPEFQKYLQDALDLIEFANGGMDTKWGALRAQMGHPEPFNLEYVGIGNEQWETERVDFFARYSAFEKAIHEVYPDIELLGSAGPDVTTEKYTKAWEFYRRETKNNSKFTAAVDEHYYMPPKWFYENLHMYDDYSREIPVFAGEYAAHCEKKQNNMEAALAEAAFMCGLERNADVIRFASAAPLFARKDYWQWIPDYIWFDGNKAMGTPGYYVQALFGNYTGKAVSDYLLEEAGKDIYSVVSEDDAHYYVKIVNAGAKEECLEEVCVKADLKAQEDMIAWQMSAPDLKTENELGKEIQVALSKKAFADGKLPIPAYSVTAVVIAK